MWPGSTKGGGSGGGAWSGVATDTDAGTGTGTGSGADGSEVERCAAALMPSVAHGEPANTSSAPLPCEQRCAGATRHRCNCCSCSHVEHTNGPGWLNMHCQTGACWYILDAVLNVGTLVACRNGRVVSKTPTSTSYLHSIRAWESGPGVARLKATPASCVRCSGVVGQYPLPCNPADRPDTAEPCDDDNITDVAAAVLADVKGMEKGRHL